MYDNKNNNKRKVVQIIQPTNNEYEVWMYMGSYTYRGTNNFRGAQFSRSKTYRKKL